MKAQEYRILRALEELGGIGTSTTIAEHIAKREGITDAGELWNLSHQAGGVLRENVGFTTVVSKSRRHNGTFRKTYRLDIRLPSTFREAQNLGRMKL